MHGDELVRALEPIPGTQVAGGPVGLVKVHVPALGDTVQLNPSDVLEAYEVDVPTGAPAVRLAVRRGHGELPLIVTADDLVFQPADPGDMVERDTVFPVPAAPNLVAYSEMHRDVRALGRAIDLPELEPEILAATLLMQRCFVVGAVEIGLWPVRVAAWWEYSWAKAGARLLLPPFRPDADWDRLMADVSEARRHTADARL